MTLIKKCTAFSSFSSPEDTTTAYLTTIQNHLFSTLISKTFTSTTSSPTSVMKSFRAVSLLLHINPHNNFVFFITDKLDFEGNMVPIYEEMTVQSNTVRQSTVMQPGDLGNLTSSIMGSVEKINDSAASVVSKSSIFQGS